MKVLGTLMLVCVFVLPAVGADKPRTEAAKVASYSDFLSTDAIGAADFIRQHPEWDGRGVVVAVLDTGVDIMAEGLKVTSTGEPKVIVAKDFSGQGVVHLSRPKEVQERDETVLRAGNTVVHGHTSLKPAPVPESLMLGSIEEVRFANSAVPDINLNGRENDKFAVLVGTVEEDGKKRSVAWIDMDADGLISDEKPLDDYSVSKTGFYLVAEGDEDPDKVLAMALEIAEDQREVRLHFADGSHGTHVAGIATGYNLFGKAGFNGIAPGARLMSLKIGDNTLAGGSTTTESMRKALEFAAQWSEQNNTPVVANVSYGIGTEAEGASDIDYVVDNLIARYPLFAVATSAGNSGPGLSTVGTPAGAYMAFSTAAMLEKGNAQSLYGDRIARDQIFSFSSRGGELAKPDGLCPGAALSQVPAWETWAVMKGTSMASPQAAGALALLASAAVQSNPKVEFNGAMLARALRNSGRPLPGYTPLDQGSGVVNVPSAFESLKSLASRPSAASIAAYQVQADCPTCDDGVAQTAFFRAGTWYPRPPAAVSFRVSPSLMSNVKAEQAEDYFEVIDLVRDADSFVTLSADSISFRKDGSASVDVTLLPEKLKKPGIHTSIVRGTPRELGKDRKNTVFELWVVVIVPYIYDLSSGFRKVIKEDNVPPGELQRYFLRVPEAASGMSLGLEAVQGRFAKVNLLLFRPDGREHDCSGGLADSEKNQKAFCNLDAADLEPGVWEVIVAAPTSAVEKSSFVLTTSFSGFKVDPPKVLNIEPANPPTANFTVTPMFDMSFQGRVSGGIYGMVADKKYDTSGDSIEFEVRVPADVVAVRLHMEIPKADYKRFTDVAVNVSDQSGRTVTRSGFSTRVLDLVLAGDPSSPEARSYAVVVQAGMAKRSDVAWSVSTTEYYEKRTPMTARVYCNYSGFFVMYPAKPARCVAEFQGKPEALPAGFQFFGDFRFKDETTRTEPLVVPFRIRPAGN